VLPVPLEPGADHRRGDEPGHARRQVDDVAAAEVQRAVRRPPAAAPQQERVHRVGKGDPERDEDQPDLEADPADHAADEQDRGDRGEHELEVDQRPLRESEFRHQPVQRRDLRLSLLGRGTHHGSRLTEEGTDPRRAEPHLEGPQDPHDEHQAERAEHHQHGVDGPLSLHEAAVEDGEGGDAHEADQGRGRHLPRVVTRTQPRCVRIHCFLPLVG